jgi:hypothetical protein
MPLTKATTNVVNLDKDTLINSLTVGRGGGNIASNTAVGDSALGSNTTGIGNAAVGYRSLDSNTTGSNNTALGYAALYLNTIGINNTSVGFQALELNTTGNNNTAVGFQALELNTTGNNNTAVGMQALELNTTGINNTALGAYSLNDNTIGTNNTAVGYAALQVNTSGIQNTAVGHQALVDNTTGNYNVALGLTALGNNTTGTNNTALGYSALTANTGLTNTTGVGNDADVTGSNQVQLGNSATTTYAYGAVANRSDIRDKTDVRDTTLGLEFVNALRPVDFKWDMREDYRAKAPKTPEQDATEAEKAAYKVAKDKWLEDVKLSNITHDGSKKRSRFHHGLIAQEVKAVLDEKGIDFGGFQDHKVKGGDDVLSIGYEELIAPMLKAIQELSAEVAALKAK